jgi:lipopolysaccharide biosynthesis glycosyltransferase
MLNIFIGCDDVEMIAYHVLADSIMRHASVPVSITPIRLSNMKNVYKRERDPKQSNEFSFSRFMVPWLCSYKGWALFLDCDMLVRCDIKELFDLLNPEDSVQCVMHDYISCVARKYLGNVQYAYPRKNWSSVMLFNCAKCKTLTPDYVNEASQEALHRMYWAESIGGLPMEWNWLVGEYDYNADAKILHWTIGGPWFKEYENCDYSEEWYDAARLACNVRDGSDRVKIPRP